MREHERNAKTERRERGFSWSEREGEYGSNHAMVTALALVVVVRESPGRQGTRNIFMLVRYHPPQLFSRLGLFFLVFPTFFRLSFPYPFPV